MQLKQKAIDNVDTFEREKDKFTAEGVRCSHAFWLVICTNYCFAEEEPERDDALPWEFTNPGMGVYIEEMQDIIRKLSQV